MTLPFKTRTMAVCAVAAFLCIAAKAQTPAPNTTEWENEALSLRLFYPSDLVKADPAQLMHDGHLVLFGVSDPKLAEATRCLRPQLYLELPQSGPAQTTTTKPTPNGDTRVTITPATTATLVLAELDIDCLNAEHESNSTTLLADLAEVVNKVPGMMPIAQPSWYNVGWQKVHMAAAQGQPGQRPNGLLQLFTMALSTNWNNHLLVWYFSSNSIDTLNRITKTTVRFGRAQAAPLYSVSIGTASH
jgi:hypothetical protein